MNSYLEVDINGLAIGGVYNDVDGLVIPESWVVLVGEAQIGWSWDGSAWIEPAPMPVSVEELREERDELLTASDFSQLPDTPLTEEDRDAWRIYRQSLRDLPENYVPVVSPEWPQINNP
mgnify:CR=1 FL=1